MNTLWHRTIFYRMITQSAGLIGISALLGFATIDRARLPSDFSQAEKESAGPVAAVSLEQVRGLVAEGTAVYIDARSASEFKKGHVRGAVSMPLGDLDQALSRNLELFTQNKPIVIYCGGEECDLSHLLARKLAAIGMDQVSVFTAGWNGWKSAGLPVEP